MSEKVYDLKPNFLYQFSHIFKFMLTMKKKKMCKTIVWLFLFFAEIIL